MRADRSEVMKGVAGLPIDPMCGREAEWPLQIPEAIGVELVRQASLAETGTSGAFDTPPHLPSRESSLVRPPTIRAGGAENGGRHRPSVTRHAVRWLAPGYGAGAVIHERVPSETDLLGRRLLAWSTATRGWLSLMGTVGCQAEPGRTRIGATVSVGIGPLSRHEADARLRRNRIRPQPTAGFT